MPLQRFILNGKKVEVDVESDERLLWVLRDILGVKGPKYGCGIGACQACTSHLNGRAVNICCIPVGKLKPTDRVTTIEGLGATVGKELHPMQEAWLKHDVAQCGYCQPGQIMAAVAKVNEVRRSEGRRGIRNADIDEIRNMCRCGTYTRIREAIKDGAKGMPKAKRKQGGRKQKAAPADRSAPATAPETAAPAPAGAGGAEAAPAVPDVGKVVPEAPSVVPDVPGAVPTVPAAPSIDLGVIQVK